MGMANLPRCSFPPMATATGTSQFTGVDFLNFDSLLAEEERAVRDTVRAWVDENLIPIIGQAYVEGKFPKQLIPGMAELGLFGANLPEEYGCAGLNNVAYGLIMQELERGDSGIRSFASVQGALVMYPISIFGTVEQKERFLPKLAAGEMIGCFGLTEPDHGSDPGSMVTSALKTDGGWILNGAKAWITNSPIAVVGVVWAKAKESKNDEPVIRGFLVEKGMEGYSAPATKHKMSLRASSTGEMVFEDVFVPDENVFPEIRGLKGPFMCLNSARYGIAWGVVGAAEFCYQKARQYVSERKQFGYPIAANQLPQTKLANMLTDITSMQMLAWRLGRLKDEGRDHHGMTSLVKRHNTGKALEIARVARDMHGGNGITGEYRVIHHMVNLESVNTYEGTYDIHGLILGREITGIQAFMPRGNDMPKQ
jgi:glutaryl-CoA dehydrogenase